jgi:S-layer homology domain
MKKNNPVLLILPILFALFAVSANAQITSISQIKDVQPTDKHFMALQSLVERYGVFSEEKFRANDPLTREEFSVLLNKSLDTLVEIAASTDEDIAAYELFTGFSANKTNITSISQIKDIKASYSQYVHLESLIERYGIDICDADKNFRPTKTVTEKEFYTWIAKIFNGSANSSPSATKAITRSEWIIVMEAALDSVNERIAKLVDEKQAAKKPKPKSKLEIIQSLPSKGKAQIIEKLKFYMPDNPCADLTNAGQDLKTAFEKGGIWGEYRINKGDIGDIVFETNNTCKKGEKIVIMRIGTAIVTMQEKGIKRLK